MSFGFVSIVLIVIAAAFILLAIRILFNPHWFLGFLRGFAGLSLLLLAVWAVLLSLNIATYQSLKSNQLLASISFTEVRPQEFEAVISANQGISKQEKYLLHGDMWQIEARVLDISMASNRFYQLNQLRARYYALEQEDRSADTPIRLQQDTTQGMDIWHWLKGKQSVGFIRADRAKSIFVPIADGAMYSISIDKDSLQVKAANAQADNALKKF